MKKKLEAELISIAHRVLKLKNRSQTIQLHEEVKKLYEQLTVLRFYEEHILIAEKEISREDLETKLEQMTSPINEEETVQEEIVQEEALIEEPEIPVFSNEVEEEEAEADEVEDTIKHEEEVKTPQPALFDDFDVANYAEPEFIKVEDVPKEVEKVASTTFEAPPEPVFEEKEPLAPVTLEVPKKETPEVVFEEAKSKSLNDRLNGIISFGLNDRIAFEKKLFGGNPDDFNRVVSQINTFDSYQEVEGFINDFVKPDYNNWDGKEEYETRFLEIIEKKFN